MRGGRKSLLWLGSGALLSLCLYFVLSRLELEGVEFSLFGREMKLSEGSHLLLWSALPLLIGGMGISRADLPLGQRLLSFFLRASFLFLLVLGLSEPRELRSSSRICAFALVDVSGSVSDAALEDFGRRIIELSRARRGEDALRLVVFGEEAEELPISELPRAASDWEKVRKRVGAEHTRVDRALELTSALSQTDCVRRYALFSDGLETAGSAESFSFSDDQVAARLYVSTPESEVPSDVALSGLKAPEAVRMGEPFSLRVTLRATRATRGKLKLFQGETLNGLEGIREIEVPAGESSHTFPTVVRVAGETSYRAEFLPSGEDHFSENNLYEISLEVPGPPRVLVVDSKPSQITHYVSALAAQQLDVEVRRPASFPQSEAELGSFQFVVLSDVPRASFARRSEVLVESYVRSGGGFLFAGGEAGFGPGGWEGSRLAKILPVAMSSQKERQIPGVAMSLVIDRSGSMTGQPLAMAKEACIATLGVLEGHDLIEVIAFDSRPTRYVKLQPARYRSRIESSLAKIAPGGGTEIFSSLDMAYEGLSAVEARKKHIILLTDGNAGSDGLYELASTALAEGITITTVGLGGGVNQSLLSMIADAGGGRSHVAEDPSRLPRIFTRETVLISQKDEAQDWFPVGQVSSPEFLRGVGLSSAPYLRGYTSTDLAAAPSEMVLRSDRGEPILARRPVGLGWTLAWTSDLKTRWAVDWLSWGSFGKLMAQMVRSHQLKDDTEIRPMSVELRGDRLLVSVDTYDEEENFDSSLISMLKISKMGSGKEEPRRVAFRRVAPGLIQAQAHLPETGAYSLSADHHRVTASGKKVTAGVSFGSVSVPYPAEFARLEPRDLELRSWAQATGGDVLEVQALWDAGSDRVEELVGRQSDVTWLALLLFLLDLLVRRVRIFDPRRA